MASLRLLDYDIISTADMRLLVLQEPSLSHVKKTSHILVIAVASKFFPRIGCASVRLAAIDLEYLCHEGGRRADVWKDYLAHLVGDKIVCILR